ncbi:MAG TPA: RhuM family protein [Syntrophales bacterium]|nr:RhuM family protein [Syntrophales bacterium]
MRQKNLGRNILREPPADYGQVVMIYESPEGVRVDVKLERETIWLTQRQMSELFQTERSVITKHLGNIFISRELLKDSVCAFFAHTARDGKTYESTFYNLDAVISVGYRVNSKSGTQFRIWTDPYSPTTNMQQTNIPPCSAS